MLRVVLNVCCPEQAFEADLEVPAEIPLAELDVLISRAARISHDADGRLQRHFAVVLPIGRRVQSGETLADAAVWDGLTLELTPISAAILNGASGASFTLRASPVTLGRAASETIAPDDSFINLAGEAQGDTVSRQHAQMACVLGVWQLQHLSTINATTINGQPVERNVTMALRDGDQISVGAVSLVFQLEVAWSLHGSHAAARPSNRPG